MARWRPVDFAAALCVAAFALISMTLAIRQHDSFHTHAFDLGYIDNVMWNTSQGRLFVNDFPDKPGNFLGEHFSPALMLVPSMGGPSTNHNHRKKARSLASQHGTVTVVASQHPENAQAFGFLCGRQEKEADTVLEGTLAWTRA